MTRIERFDLVDRIGRELQSRMTYSDISAYLSSFGISVTKETSSVNSKWVYTKELLQDVPDSTVLKLADELEIDHGPTRSRDLDLSDSRFWLTGHFRLFLSHLASFKQTMSQLQKGLRAYGISAFVAHEDVEPTREWQDEIEKALFSMDAFAAILMPGFKSSDWTDQEVGAAIGRDVLIVPIRKGLDPYGFIAKYQGMQGEGKTIAEVADYLFQILGNHAKTKSKMADALVQQVLVSTRVDEATDKLTLLRRIGSLPEKHLEKLRANVLQNDSLAASERFLSSLNELLSERGLPAVVKEQETTQILDDDIPF
jgi:hypothetical protein